MDYLNRGIFPINLNANHNRGGIVNLNSKDLIVDANILNHFKIKISGSPKAVIAAFLFFCITVVITIYLLR